MHTIFRLIRWEVQLRLYFFKVPSTIETCSYGKKYYFFPWRLHADGKFFWCSMHHSTAAAPYSHVAKNKVKILEIDSWLIFLPSPRYLSDQWKNIPRVFAEIFHNISKKFFIQFSKDVTHTKSFNELRKCLLYIWLTLEITRSENYIPNSHYSC